ncbi:hypothetical protein [Parasulfitobacter algicola]|uniref:Uncharacterized protein n=1 Tax=Parasulfitobacter algicola TaxID=2614809 RepID=A0ABX2IKM5_9RHOB|nr:hypothetical protein [Sulfitobacter algicola]NSX53429.1 hypothetical protein [Sulfitobacter algicola]
MMRAFFRCVLLAGLLTGILIPKMSAALVMLVPGMQIMVICTGAETVIITLDPDGEPVEMPEATSKHCVMNHAMDLADTPEPAWQKFIRSFHNTFTINSNQRAQDHLALVRGPTRAPPVLI